MAIAAHLYQDDRWAERHSVELDATLRDPTWAPVDVVVEDLSERGFRVLAARDLPIGAEIGLGLSGVGLRHARVVRRADRAGAYGCEFLSPLARPELRTALQAPHAAPISLLFNATPTAAEIELIERLPIRTRMLAIAAGAIGSWALVIGLGWTLVKLAALAV